jgi:hypothetical protein
MGHIARLC